MGAIYKRDIESHFNSMIGYIYTAVVVFLIGIFFVANNINNGYPYFSSVLSSILFLFIIATPILTMRSLSEEKRAKTDQLLLTYPISVTKVILGKYFAMITVYAIPIIISCLCPIVIAIKGDAFLLVDYCSIFAFMCMGCLFVAIGMFISSLTESQIISAIVTFCILLVVYFWNGLWSLFPTGAGANLLGIIIIITIVALLLYAMSKHVVLSVTVEAVLVVAAVVVYFIKSSLYDSLLLNAVGGLSISSTFDNFITYKVFDLGGIFFYLSLAALFVFLTIQTVQKRRWN